MKVEQSEDPSPKRVNFTALISSFSLTIFINSQQSYVPLSGNSPSPVEEESMTQSLDPLKDSFFRYSSNSYHSAFGYPVCFAFDNKSSDIYSQFPVYEANKNVRTQFDSILQIINGFFLSVQIYRVGKSRRRVKLLIWMNSQAKLIKFVRTSVINQKGLKLND